MGDKKPPYRRVYKKSHERSIPPTYVGDDE